MSGMEKRAAELESQLAAVTQENADLKARAAGDPNAPAAPSESQPAATGERADLR